MVLKKEKMTPAGSESSVVSCEWLRLVRRGVALSSLAPALTFCHQPKSLPAMRMTRTYFLTRTKIYLGSITIVIDNDDEEFM